MDLSHLGRVENDNAARKHERNEHGTSNAAGPVGQHVTVACTQLPTGNAIKIRFPFISSRSHGVI